MRRKFSWECFSPLPRTECEPCLIPPTFTEHLEKVDSNILTQDRPRHLDKIEKIKGHLHSPKGSVSHVADMVPGTKTYKRKDL